MNRFSYLKTYWSDRLWLNAYQRLEDYKEKQALLKRIEKLEKQVKKLTKE